MLAVLRQLGLSESDVTPRTYLEVFMDETGSSGGKVPDMVFDDEEMR